jgi:hypothetical protein
MIPNAIAQRVMPAGAMPMQPQTPQPAMGTAMPAVNFGLGAAPAMPAQGTAMPARPGFGMMPQSGAMPQRPQPGSLMANPNVRNFLAQRAGLMF